MLSTQTFCQSPSSCFMILTLFCNRNEVSYYKKRPLLRKSITKVLLLAHKVRIHNRGKMDCSDGNYNTLRCQLLPFGYIRILSYWEEDVNIYCQFFNKVALSKHIRFLFITIFLYYRVVKLHMDYFSVEIFFKLLYYHTAPKSNLK